MIHADKFKINWITYPCAFLEITVKIGVNVRFDERTIHWYQKPGKQRLHFIWSGSHDRVYRILVSSCQLQLNSVTNITDFLYEISDAVFEETVKLKKPTSPKYLGIAFPMFFFLPESHFKVLYMSRAISSLQCTT